MLMHFIQKSPGDYVPQESILKVLGISAEVCVSTPPQVSSGLGRHCLLRASPTPNSPGSGAWHGQGLRWDPAGFRSSQEVGVATLRTGETG